MGETFFKATIYRVTWSGSGPVTLSGSNDGTANTLVDDVLILNIVHPDGSKSKYTHDYSNGCSGSNTPLPPVNIASKFRPGANKVTATLKDKCGGAVLSDPLWLTG